MKASEFGLKVFLFIWHICVFTFWVILLRFVRDEDGEYTFNPVSVIVLTELCKFLLSFIFHCYSEGYGSQSSISKVFYELRSHWTQGKFFAVPALIYAVYNSLLFFNLKNFDPTAYKVLINIRILWSGLLFQIFFGKKLGVRRWAALCLLAIACAINQINDDFELNVPLTAFIGVIVQSFTSSLGGVYSEFYLKKQNKLSMNVKNIYLYGFSVVFNLAWIVVGQPSIVTNPAQFFQGFSGFVVLIVFLGSFAGFSTALFLRYLNLILKEYAHSGELFLTAFLSWMFFGTELNWRVLASIFLVSVSVIIYNTAPDHQNSTDSSSSSSSSSSSMSSSINSSQTQNNTTVDPNEQSLLLFCHGGMEMGIEPKQFLAQESAKRFHRLEKMSRRTQAKNFTFRRPSDRQGLSDTDLAYNGFMWSDFCLNRLVETLSYNPGRGYVYSKPATEHLLKSYSTQGKNNIRVVLRGHQHSIDQGILFHLINKEGVLGIWADRKNKAHPRKKKKDDHYDEKPHVIKFNLQSGNLVYTLLSAPSSSLLFGVDNFVNIHVPSENFDEWRLYQVARQIKGKSDDQQC